ncbi:unnamed protein product [Lactuca saligna]|uniref:Uncharacterized protein n=1 Tax=Lactuca saligna TaxID=75948 RepID=A0AA35ZAD8_LACSI|nr:unnamed protein product [Lactuca saligna]
MFQYLSTWFDFRAITNHPMASTYWASLNNQICARYRGRKNNAKNRSARNNRQCWNVTIDYFLTEKHQKRSARNKECWKKQVVKNRGGTCSYCSACFKKLRLEVFHHTHVNKKGEFVDPLVEEQYNVLVVEVALQTYHIVDFGGDPYTIDWITISQNVLGSRRGHVKGIEPKPSLAAGTSASSQ